MKQVTLKKSILNFKFEKIAQFCGVGAFSLIVVTLILIDIFDIKADHFEKLFAASPAQIKVKESPFKSKRATKEVHQYTEFITVQHSTLKLSITTGIRYDDSTNQNIVAQWCYAMRGKTANDGFAVHLTIQKINNGKITKYTPYSVQTLRKLNLTQNQAQGLSKYCRFKTA
tara:strand:- start:63 stop:575 length:513 start_codon:yes stop_codon:yes gene_type:complete